MCFPGATWQSLPAGTRIPSCGNVRLQPQGRRAFPQEGRQVNSRLRFRSLKPVDTLCCVELANWQQAPLRTWLFKTLSCLLPYGVVLVCSRYHRHHHQLSSAVQPVFDILSLCLDPSLSVLSCPFECNKAIIICQIMYWHLNSSPPSCWFSSHYAFSEFVQTSVVSQNMAN